MFSIFYEHNLLQANDKETEKEPVKQLFLPL